MFITDVFYPYYIMAPYYIMNITLVQLSLPKKMMVKKTDPNSCLEYDAEVPQN